MTDAGACIVPAAVAAAEESGADGKAALRAFIAATEATGLAFNPDFNGAEQEGLGIWQQTAFQRRRSSSSRAFLHPALADLASV